jgi:hypothetical protein
MLDQTQWPRGKQFTVLEVKPPPEGRPYVLQQVALVPRGEHEPQFSLWCQARISGAALLQEHDAVAVKGKNLSSVLVERLVQEVPDGLQYLLARLDPIKPRSRGYQSSGSAVHRGFPPYRLAQVTWNQGSRATSAGVLRRSPRQRSAGVGETTPRAALAARARVPVGPPTG